MGTEIDLIVGLGNPGPEYQATRHNAGFWFVDLLAREHGGSFAHARKLQGETAEVRIAGRRMRLLKPMTQMNSERRIRQAAVSYYKIPVEHVLVAYDELDFLPGRAQLKFDGSGAGHNGVGSVIEHVGTKFWRLRFGVGHPRDRRSGKAPRRDRSRARARGARGRRAILATIGEAVKLVPVMSRGRRGAREESPAPRSPRPRAARRASRLMGIKCGIVGLPNVGKSTLFNALTASEIPAENYPFCTIDPNVGVVTVPDPKLDAIAEIVKPEKVVPTVVEFVDIAGLVAGASQGQGLGNQFLAHIRETHAIAHLVRCFENDDITHVAGKVNPLHDIEIIDTELMLADLDTVQKMFQRADRAAKTNEKAAVARRDGLKKLQDALESGQPARTVVLDEREAAELKDLHLITAKPVMYIANVAEVRLGKTRPRHR